MNDTKIEQEKSMHKLLLYYNQQCKSINCLCFEGINNQKNYFF